MKKILLLLVVIPLFLSMFASQAKFSEEKASISGFETIFEDNFERYAVSTFPYAGGWELWFDGAGMEYQVVTEYTYASPTKSLQLLGLHGWAAFAAKPFYSGTSKIGFQAYARVEELQGGTADSARIAFTKLKSSSTSHEYAAVCFLDNGTMVSGGKILQYYAAKRWYQVKVILDKSSDTYGVWIDGVLRADNLHLDRPSYEIEAFSVSQCYNNVKVYFDDAKIFELALPKTSTEILFKLRPNPAVLGQTITLVGYLKDQSGTAIGNVPVEVFYSIDNGVNWIHAGTLQTNSTGYFRATGKLTLVGYYLIGAIYRGNSTYNPCHHIETLGIRLP